MANSEQQDILDELVHIYECDEQHVSVLVIPTDNEIREDLLVSIEDDESNTVYTTTTTDTYGMINTTFSLSPGAHTPTIKCGNNKYNIYDTSVICHACSLTLTYDKDILSAADGDIATLTATLIGTESGYDGPLSDRKVIFEIYQASDNTLIETLTATTNSSGVATVSYSSQGIGDISIIAKVGSLVSEIFVVHDYQYYANNMQKIKDTFINDTSVSGRTIYESPFTFSSDVELEFKLKNIPQSWLVGFGSNGTTVNNKGVWFKVQNYNQNKASIMYADTGGTGRDVSITTDYGTSTVFTIKSENIHKIYWCLDSVVRAYRDTHTGTPLGLRFDVFDNQDYDIEYIKVKPL